MLADDNGTDPVRTKIAGRVTPKDGLSPAEWKTFAAGANQIARAVFDETGLRTVFHHHCAGYVETPEEIATFLELTDPQRLGLVFDTGHYYHGTGQENCDLVAALDRFKDRIWYIHLKDIEPTIARRSAPSSGTTSPACATASTANSGRVASTFRPCCAG